MLDPAAAIMPARFDFQPDKGFGPRSRRRIISQKSREKRTQQRTIRLRVAAHNHTSVAGVRYDFFEDVFIYSIFFAAVGTLTLTRCARLKSM
jgi:hypothetical protein